jgi:hypothetical protein
MVVRSDSTAWWTKCVVCVELTIFFFFFVMLAA